MTKHAIGSAAALLLLTATTMTASADDDIEIKDESASASTTPPIVPPVMAGTGPLKKGTLGISVAVPGAAPAYVVNFQYFLSDKAALNVIGGFTLNRIPGNGATVPPTDPSTVFGFTAGLGYRMYKHLANNVHTYIEPFGLLSSPDAGNIGDNIAVQLGGNFGVECMLTDWFSFRGQLGGAVQFVAGVDNVQVATTTGLFGTVYWK